jgi:hypothetical protein
MVQRSRGAPFAGIQIRRLTLYPIRPASYRVELRASAWPKCDAVFRNTFRFTNEHQSAGVSSLIRRKNGVGPSRLPRACSVHKFLVSRVGDALACANQGSHIGNSSEVN